jgi:hypothetical protein
MWVMWNLISVYLEKLLCRYKIGAQFAPTYHRLRKSFWTHPMVLLGDEALVDAHFGPFGDNANLDVR